MYILWTRQKPLFNIAYVKQRTLHNYLFRFYYKVNHSVFKFSNYIYRDNSLIPVLKKYPHMKLYTFFTFIKSPCHFNKIFWDLRTSTYGSAWIRIICVCLRFVMQKWQQEITWDWLCVHFRLECLNEILFLGIQTEMKWNEINGGVCYQKYRLVWCFDLKYHASVILIVNWIRDMTLYRTILQVYRIKTVDLNTYLFFLLNNILL